MYIFYLILFIILNSLNLYAQSINGETFSVYNDLEVNEKNFNEIIESLDIWHEKINNGTLPDNEINNNLDLINDLNKFKYFVEKLLKEVGIIDNKIKNNEKIKINKIRILKDYYSFYNANYKFLEDLSSRLDVDLTWVFNEQKKYTNGIEFLLIGNNEATLDFLNPNMPAEEKIKKFLTACSQIIYLDNNSSNKFSYISEFINRYADSNYFYNFDNVKRYGVALKKEFNSVDKYDDEELSKILEYILYTDLYNAISSYIILFKTYKHEYKNMTNKQFKNMILIPLVFKYKKNNKNLDFVNKVIDKALNDFNQDKGANVVLYNFNKGINELIREYNKTVAGLNAICSAGQAISKLNENIFSCNRIGDIDTSLFKNISKQDNFDNENLKNLEEEALASLFESTDAKLDFSNYRDWYKDLLEEKYNLKSLRSSDCVYLQDLKYKENKKLYPIIKENIDFVMLEAKINNPIFLFASVNDINEKIKLPIDYSFSKKDFIYDACFNTSGNLFDKIDDKIAFKIFDVYYNNLLGEIERIFDEIKYINEKQILPLLKNQKYSKKEKYEIISERFKSSTSVILSVVENDIENKKITNNINLNLEKHLCSIVRDINRKAEIEDNFDLGYAITVITGLFVSRFKMAASAKLLVNSVVALSSFLLAKSKISNFLELKSIKNDFNKYLMTNDLDDPDYLIKTISNLKEKKEVALNDAVVESVFCLFIGFKSLKLARSSFINWRVATKFVENNSRLSNLVKYRPPKIPQNYNWFQKQMYLSKDWLKQVWTCKGTTMSGDLIKVALPTALIGQGFGLASYYYRMPENLEFDWTEVGIDTFTGILISTARNMVGIRGFGQTNKVVDATSRYIVLAGWGIIKTGVNNVSYYKFENDRPDIDRYIVSRAFGELTYTTLISPLASLSILKILKGVSCLYPSGVKGKVLKYGLMFGASYLMADAFHLTRFNSINNIYSDESAYLILSKEKVDIFVELLENYSKKTIKEKEQIFNELEKPIWDKNYYNPDEEKFLYISDIDQKVEFLDY